MADSKSSKWAKPLYNWDDHVTYKPTTRWDDQVILPHWKLLQLTKLNLFTIWGWFPLPTIIWSEVTWGRYQYCPYTIYYHIPIGGWIRWTGGTLHLSTNETRTSLPATIEKANPGLGKKQHHDHIFHHIIFSLPIYWFSYYSTL